MRKKLIVFVTTMICVTFLGSCTNKNEPVVDESITELEKNNEILLEKIALLENEIQNSVIEAQENDDEVDENDKASKSATSRWESHHEFFAELDENDDTFEALIDYYSFDIGDGAYGQAYGERVLDYFYELDIDEFLMIARRLNDRMIDDVAYNVSDYLLYQQSMSDEYVEQCEGLRNILLEKLDDTTITYADRRFIHALLSHLYNND